MSEVLDKVTTKDIIEALMSSDHNLPKQIVTELMKRVSQPVENQSIQEIPHDPEGKDLVEMFLYDDEDELKKAMGAMDDEIVNCKTNADLVKVYYKYPKRDLAMFASYIKHREREQNPIGGLLGALMAGRRKNR